MKRRGPSQRTSTPTPDSDCSASDGDPHTVMIGGQLRCQPLERGPLTVAKTSPQCSKHRDGQNLKWSFSDPLGFAPTKEFYWEKRLLNYARHRKFYSMKKRTREERNKILPELQFRILFGVQVDFGLLGAETPDIPAPHRACSRDSWDISALGCPKTACGEQISPKKQRNGA